MMRSLLTLILLTTTCIFIGSSCNTATESSDQEKKTEVTKDGPEYNSRYVCPMHCEGSGSDEPGQCPVCGMDYVLNDKYDESSDSGAAHDHDHGHDHDHDHDHASDSMH